MKTEDNKGYFRWMLQEQGNEKIMVDVTRSKC